MPCASVQVCVAVTTRWPVDAACVCHAASVCSRGVWLSRRVRLLMRMFVMPCASVQVCVPSRRVRLLAKRLTPGIQYPHCICCITLACTALQSLQ
eukprot:1391952-Amorphochlora_amoeboformis.AAC.1